MSLKHNHYAYTPLYMHKTLPTLRNKKEQKRIKNNKKSQNNLLHLPDWASAQKVRLHHWNAITNSPKVFRV